MTNRRTILKFAAAAALPAALSAPAAAQASRALHLLVVVPSREGVPGFTAAFLSGLRQTLSGVTLSVQASGTRPGDLSRTLTHPADLILVLGDGVPLPAPASSAPVILAGAGVAPTRQARQPGVLHAHLGLWERAWQQGRALAQARARPFLAMSVLDSGYDLPLAFTAGLDGTPGALAGQTVLSGGERPDALIAQARASGATHLHVQDTAGQLNVAALQGAARRAGLGFSVLNLAPQGGVHPAGQLGQDVGQWVTLGAAHSPTRHPLVLLSALSAQQFTGTRGPLRVTADGQLDGQTGAAGRAPTGVLGGVSGHRGHVHPYLHG
ncbi:hypothetical protein [Deinococcus radiotolerans]|uniref:Uncharacterized protein n=1 Tax=Deinococcus radiotolerans TaxID=1309407 RepID=A0ABQ2FRT4_9DEIO|nr:hypothetical protein [Deinococcus radiotolerans]GGL19793.1 hypothetical protein GCM10010844_43440 [Deinococcus radiotolerans]